MREPHTSGSLILGFQVRRETTFIAHCRVQSFLFEHVFQRVKNFRGLSSIVMA